MYGTELAADKLTAGKCQTAVSHSSGTELAADRPLSGTQGAWNLRPALTAYPDHAPITKIKIEWGKTNGKNLKKDTKLQAPEV